jgi:hypothetical protein
MARIAQGQRSAPTDVVLNAPPAPLFLLMHHPDSWDYHVTGTADDGTVVGEWLPRIVKFEFIPGVNGIKEVDQGGHTEAMAYFQREGWIFLDPEMEVVVSDDSGKIVKEQGYRCFFNGVKGRIWQDIWARPVVFGTGGRARVDWVADYDAAGKFEFRRMLTKKGIVPAPDPAVLASKMKIQARRAQRRAHDAHAGAAPSLLADQAAKEGKLQAMQRDAEAMTPTKRLRGARA